MTENALSILICFSVQLQQTEISERKLFIFHLGQCIGHRRCRSSLDSLNICNTLLNIMKYSQNIVTHHKTLKLSALDAVTSALDAISSIAVLVLLRRYGPELLILEIWVFFPDLSVVITTGPVWNSSSRNRVTGQSSLDRVQHWIIDSSVYLVVHRVFQWPWRSTSVMSQPLLRDCRDHRVTSRWRQSSSLLNLNCLFYN